MFEIYLTLLRIIRSPGTWVLLRWLLFSQIRSSCWTERHPISCLETRIVVRGGEVIAEYGISSNPITEMSSGTLYPTSFRAFIAPIAIESLSAKAQEGNWGLNFWSVFFKSLYEPSKVGVNENSCNEEQDRPRIRAVSYTHLLQKISGCVQR